MFKEFKGFDHEGVLKPKSPVLITNLHDGSKQYGIVIGSNPLRLNVMLATGSIEISLWSITTGGEYKITPLEFREIEQGGDLDVKTAD